MARLSRLLGWAAAGLAALAAASLARRTAQNRALP
jgi:hypothetical protein